MKRVGCPSPLNLGVGVTARSELDARAMIASCFPGAEIASITVISDVSELEAKHVLPNMGDHMVRGVWFPRQS